MVEFACGPARIPARLVTGRRADGEEITSEWNPLSSRTPTDNPSTTGPAGIRLTKHHGLGNDFLIAVDPGLDGAELPTAGNARAWCDRRTGIGADGLLLATPETGGRWRMVLWNADGSRAEISGNGIRCLGQAVVDHLQLDRSVDQDLVVETDAGTRRLTVRAAAAGTSTGTAAVRVSMGKAVPGPEPSSRWSEVGVEVIEQHGVDIGNPHLVAFVPSVAGTDMAVIGPVIEADYPSGCNVHLVEVLGSQHLDLRVWERGAGVTQACGSGACAAAWAATSAGMVDSPVTVDMPGGAATVELVDDEIFLIGPAVRVAEVIIDG